MATVMSWGDSSGIRGRCDAKCHTAKLTECVCMCGGAFHGAVHLKGGLRQALEDFWDEAIKYAEAIALQEGLRLETERWAKTRQALLNSNPKPKKHSSSGFQPRLF